MAATRLLELGDRIGRGQREEAAANDVPVLREIFGFKALRQNPKDIALLKRSVDDVIAARREEKTPRQDDLLQRMLEHPDPDTGELLSDRSIRNQALKFLIAGHETTASRCTKRCSPCPASSRGSTWCRPRGTSCRCPSF